LTKNNKKKKPKTQNTRQRHRTKIEDTDKDTKHMTYDTRHMTKTKTEAKDTDTGHRHVTQTPDT